jgi:sec-independent protein translocase protein TatB
MFGSVGMTEIMIFAGIALVIIGPDKFPGFAKIVIRTVKDVRGYVADAQRDIAKEIVPVKKELEKLSKIDPEKYIDSLTGDALKDTGMTDPAEDNFDDAEADYSADPYNVDGTYEYDAFSKDSSPESSSPESSSPESSSPDTENPEKEAGDAPPPEPTGDVKPASSNGAGETVSTDEDDVPSERLDK